MASSRWALRAAATVTALAFALPFSSGTATADPLIQILGDNHVNATIGVSGNVDMIDVAAHAHVSLDTGPGITVLANGGIQVALGLGAHVNAGVGADVNVGALVDADVSANVGLAVGADVAAAASADVAVAATTDVAADVAGAKEETTATDGPPITTGPAGPAGPISAVTEDKATAIHIGGIWVNVGPHAAAMLDAHVGPGIAVDASVGATASVGVSSSIVDVSADAAVAADASVDLGSGDVSASAFVGVGLTIG